MTRVLQNVALGNIHYFLTKSQKKVGIMVFIRNEGVLTKGWNGSLPYKVLIGKMRFYHL
jgi:hypothetical protein